jgi:hypothetical protein
MYDFHDPAQDMNALAIKARELEDQQRGMSKKVNPKVVTMIERCDREKGHSHC